MNQDRRLRKRLGCYYTPQDLANALADWALADADTAVLDPSFGGCAFFNAAWRVLESRGSESPGQHIYGVDIDPEALAYVQPLVDAGTDPRHFIIADFFEVRPGQFDRTSFGAVVGNPPYVRHHALDSVKCSKAAASLDKVGVQLTKRASYWAYFIVHSLEFLQPDGRLAFVLPGSLLHADYADSLRSYLVESFRHVAVLLIRERVFPDAQEKAVVLLAEGFGQPNKGVSVLEVASVRAVPQVCATLPRSMVTTDSLSGDGGWLRPLLGKDTLDLLESIFAEPNVQRLGDHADVHIGVVTGNNRFFIISRHRQEHICIPERDLKSVVPHASLLKCLSFRDSDLDRLVSSGREMLLISPDDPASISPGLRKYISAGQQICLDEATKCRSRNPWYSVPSTFVPHAFVPYMGSNWPRIILNQSHATCTNAIHRLVWKEHVSDEDAMRLALGSVSSLAQLSAELVGRSYGGGVLKLEPRGLRRLAIPAPSLKDPTRLSEVVDRLLRAGDMASATNIVDRAVLVESLGLSEPALRMIRSARDALRRNRSQAKESSPH